MMITFSFYAIRRSSRGDKLSTTTKLSVVESEAAAQATTAQLVESNWNRNFPYLESATPAVSVSSLVSAARHKMPH